MLAVHKFLIQFCGDGAGGMKRRRFGGDVADDDVEVQPEDHSSCGGGVDGVQGCGMSCGLVQPQLYLLRVFRALPHPLPSTLTPSIDPHPLPPTPAACAPAPDRGQQATYASACAPAP